ncbi:MAG: hypothetical protein KGI37_02255 [Alphaproteobacteria bacterium]|nr:hypothetical protein [Alphaproteobacteria bacterium]
MHGSRVKPLSLFLIVLVGMSPAAGFAAPRDASFTAVATPGAAPPAFSGLAATFAPAAAPQVVSPPVAASTGSTPAASAPILGTPVEAAPLPDVSPESVGLSGAGMLGADMWKGTPRAVAEPLLAMLTPTSSPALNDVARRMLATAAVPPSADAAAKATSRFTALRIEKLAAFADARDAWALASRADPGLIDDKTMRAVAGAALLDGRDDVCGRMPALMQKWSQADWQEVVTICQLRAKNDKAAEVALDVLRAETPRDDMFLQVADKNILAGTKTLPTQLTPLTPTLLAALQLSGLPLPEILYGHPDDALTPFLLDAPARENVARLGLAERAAQRGIIAAARLAAVYRDVAFKPDELAAPLAAPESGSRMRALLYQAALAEKDASKRVAYAARFMQMTPSPLLDAAGPLLADMAGDATPDATNTVMMAQIDMLAGRDDMAQKWFALAARDFTHDDMRALWPQFVLAGLVPDGDYAAELGPWVDAVLAAPNPNADANKGRGLAAATLLLFDAAGHVVPDTVWAKVIAAHDNKPVVFSPLLFDRLRDAAAAGRRGETVLLALDIAGAGDIPLPVAAQIVRSLRAVGLTADAQNFAREALMTAMQGM